MALSGGSTPRSLFALLAGEPYRGAVDWSRLHVFWGDERCVPPDHTESNFFHAHRALLSQVSIPQQNIHRIPTELEPQLAALRYEQDLREFFGVEQGSPTTETFDLLLLGLGEDAHTASLFPGSNLLREQERWAAEVYVPSRASWRISLTPPLLNSARRTCFLITGAEKQWAVQHVLYGTYRPARYPAQIVRPTSGDLLWLMDEAAAGDDPSRAA